MDGRFCQIMNVMAKLADVTIQCSEKLSFGIKVLAFLQYLLELRVHYMQYVAESMPLFLLNFHLFSQDPSQVHPSQVKKHSRRRIHNRFYLLPNGTSIKNL